MSPDTPTPIQRDIDLVLVTGAGASCAFGVNDTRVPLMGDWSEELVSRLAAKGGGFLSTTGLTRGMDGPAFEDQLGRFLRAATAFDAVEMLLEPVSSFPLNGAQMVAPGQWSDWHRQTKHALAQVVEVIHESLLALFASPAFDPGAAQQGYGALLAALGVGPASRFVLATTNYDTIAEETLVALGRMPDVGDFEASPYNAERMIRTDRLLDGMPRYTPVLHLHGRVGWFRRHDGRIASIPGRAYAADTGVPIVMLPDLEKNYESDSIINTLWEQFAEAVRRAKRILVLGHSLHDEALIRTLAENVSAPARLAVTVLPSQADVGEPDGDEAFKVRERIRERLPGAKELLVRFDSEVTLTDGPIRDWMAAA